MAELTARAAPIILPKLIQAPSPNQSDRGGARIDLFVLHETAGSYAGAVSWLRNPASRASATLVLREDGREASQLVPIRRKPWTQGRRWNPVSVSLELANVTAKGYHSEFQLRVAARIAAWVCWKLSLPPRWARHGAGRGLTYHGDLPESGSHPYCGPTPAAWARFLDYVGAEIERGDFLKTWARF